MSTPEPNTYTHIDISALEAIPAFRADELFFIRLAGTYMQAIFWDVFRNTTNNGKSRRKRMREIAEQEITGDRQLLDALKHQKTLDVFKQPFTDFLEALPHNMADIQTTFKERMQHDHALFLSYAEYIKMLKILREKRHNLEHYTDRLHKPKTYRPEDVMHALGTFLLPQHHNMFLGRLYHYTNRLTAPDQLKALDYSRPHIEKIFKECRKTRKEHNKKLFSEERRRQIMPKAKRKSYDAPGQTWRKIMQKHSGQKSTDYNAFQFKTRYYFIGEQNFNQICKLLNNTEATPLSFRDHIEPFYLLTTRINLHLHRYLDTLPKDANGKIEVNNNQDKQKLRALRNTIAHNGLFWHVYHKENGENIKLDVNILLSLLLAHLYQQNKETANNFYTGLKRLLEKEKYALAYCPQAQDTAPKQQKITRWTPQNRETYINQPAIKLDKRNHLKYQLANWATGLQQAGKSVGFEKKND